MIAREPDKVLKGIFSAYSKTVTDSLHPSSDDEMIQRICDSLIEHLYNLDHVTWKRSIFPDSNTAHLIFSYNDADTRLKLIGMKQLPVDLAPEEFSQKAVSYLADFFNSDTLKLVEDESVVQNPFDNSEHTSSAQLVFTVKIDPTKKDEDEQD